MSSSIVSTLRAMARNYAGGHNWDHLDGEAVSLAAAEIERLSRKAANADLALAAQTRQVHTLRAKLAELPEKLISSIEDEQARCTADDYLMDSEDCIKVIRESLFASAEPSAPCKQGSPLEAVRATVIQDLLDRAATAIGQYGDSLLGRGQREDSVDLLDLEREVRDLEQEFRGAFALTST